jgi:hypothetical protein
VSLSPFIRELCGTGTVDGQLEDVRYTVELFVPVRQLFVERSSC